MPNPECSNLKNCIENTFDAASKAYEDSYLSYNKMLGDIEQYGEKLSSLYKDEVYFPFKRSLQKMDEKKYNEIIFANNCCVA